MGGIFVAKSRKIKNPIGYISLIIIFIMLAVIFWGVSNKAKPLETLFYTEKSNINYEVCLKENNFYEEKCQAKDMSYIASAIDYVNVFFDYNFKVNSNLDYKYDYHIYGIISIYDRDDPENVLFTRTVELLDNQEKKLQGISDFNIHETLKINYQEYNELIKSFKTVYNVSVASNLKLKMYIKTNGVSDKIEDPIKTDSQMEITIPLTENTIRINMNYIDINKSDKLVLPSDKTIINTICFALCIGFISLAAITLFIMIIGAIRKENKKSEYEKFIENKLKNLDRMIVSAKENVIINEEDYSEIIDVQNFSELIDIADRLMDIITWTEVIHITEKVSWFTVSDEKRLYRIIYRSTDTDFK